jgi:hypothetical protein
VALCGSGARAEESPQRQAGEGVKVGIEVDAEVHGTHAELVVVPVGSKDDRTRWSMEMCSRWKKRLRGVACGRL